MRGKKVNDQVAVGFNVESNWCEFTEPITECSEATKMKCPSTSDTQLEIVLDKLFTYLC